MDRGTIKILLMTTSVVALVAGSGQDAAASPCAGVSGGTVPSFTQTTSVNCIAISNEQVTGDVTIDPGVTVGGTNLGSINVQLSNVTIGGGIINLGTVFTNAST